MNLLRRIMTNGYILIFPIIIWNISFFSYLPSSYAPSNFNSDIPLWIIVGENLFRMVLFIFPLFVQVNIKISFGNKGLIIYLLGVLIYFSSWLAIIISPSSVWSSSVLGYSAPAYTPIIWILGLSMMVDSYYFKYRLNYSKWHFLLPSLSLIGFHISHAIYVYNRTYL